MAMEGTMAGQPEERQPNWFQQQIQRFREGDARQKLLTVIVGLLLLALAFFAVFGATRALQDAFGAERADNGAVIPGVNGQPGAVIQEGSVTIWDNCTTPILGKKGDVFRITDASGAKHEVTITHSGGVCFDGQGLPKPIQITPVD